MEELTLASHDESGRRIPPIHPHIVALGWRVCRNRY
jgi:hypothetical protein